MGRGRVRLLLLAAFVLLLWAPCSASESTPRQQHTNHKHEPLYEPPQEEGELFGSGELDPAHPRYTLDEIRRNNMALQPSLSAHFLSLLPSALQPATAASDKRECEGVGCQDRRGVRDMSVPGGVGGRTEGRDDSHTMDGKGNLLLVDGFPSFDEKLWDAPQKPQVIHAPKVDEPHEEWEEWDD